MRCAERDRLAQLRRELELLDAEVARIARLLHLADPTGEAAARWVPKKGLPAGVPRRTFKEPVKAEVAAAPEEASSSQKEEPKPRGLLQAPKVALGGGAAKGPGNRGGLKGASMRPREEGHRTVGDSEARGDEREPSEGVAAGAAGASNAGEAEGAANSRLVGEESAPGGVSEMKESMPAETKAEHANRGVGEGDERLGEGGSRGRQKGETGPAAVADGGTDGQLGSGGSQGKGRSGQGPTRQKRTRDVVTPQGDEEQAEQPVWEPPQGQTGDGRTALNEKLGY